MRPTIYDFDAYIRQTLEPTKGTLGHVARQKLLYAVHRTAIFRTGVPAFEGKCEAWKMGPVFVELWKNPTKSGDPGRLTAEHIGYCDLVALIIGCQSGRSLAARSHAKYPEWHQARTNRETQEITIHAIRKQLELVKR